MDPRKILFILICILLVHVLLRNNDKNNAVDEVEPFGEIERPDIRYKPKKRNKFIKKHKMENRIFENVQFHNDYRDVTTILNDIVVDNKQVFNIHNEPVSHKKANEKDIKKLLVDFIDYINNMSKEGVDARHTNSGWDDATPDPKGKDGWEEYWKKLGVGQIYTNPLPRSTIALTDVEDADVYTLENTMKITTRLVIKKEFAEDELVISISFVLNDYKNDPDNVKIESAFVDGVYVYKTGLRGITEYNTYGNNYYDFDENMEKNDLTDTRMVHREVDKYYEQLEQARNTRHINSPMFEMDTPIKAMELPSLSSYGSFQMTRSACDDLYQDVDYE